MQIADTGRTIGANYDFQSDQKTTTLAHTNKNSIIKKIYNSCIPYHALNIDLENIKNKLSADSSYTINDSDINKIKEAIESCNKLFSGKLVENLKKIPFIEIKKSIFKSFENSDQINVEAYLNSFLKAMTSEEVIAFSNLKQEKIDETFEKHVLLKHTALNSVWYSKGKAIWKELYYEISYFCHHLIETFISMTGFNDIGDTSRRLEWSKMTNYEAKAKLELYATLLAYPSLLFVSSFALLGSVVLAVMVTSIIITTSIAFIPLYIRYLKPCPNQYWGLENLNQKILRKEHSPLFQRADILDQIQNAFCAGKGVLLTGDPGIGKTSIAEALASLIVLNKAKKGAHFLHRAQMFSVNANQFKGGYYDKINLHSLGETFKYHAKSFVLFVDELASIFEKEGMLGGTLGNNVKLFSTFLDKFPYVIGATTTKEYESLIKNDEPLNRRLVHIEMKPLQPNELESALYQYLHYTAPELILEADVIPYIIENAKKFNAKTSSIDGAMSLLKRAISKVTHITFENLEKKINDIKLEIEHLENGLLHNDQESEKDKIEQYQNKQKELQQVEQALTLQINALDQIKKIESLNLKFKYQGYRFAKKNTNPPNAYSKAWLNNYVIQQILTEFLIKKRNELGIPTSINKKLIDDIIRDKKLSSN